MPGGPAAAMPASAAVTQTIPVPVDHAPGVPRRDAVLGAMGQQPEQPKPALRTGTPRMRALAGAAVWALLLCLGGLVCGVLGLIQIVSGSASGWYEPVIIVVGVLGLALAAAAFPLVERRGLPWLLLAASTVTLIGGYVLTAAAS